MKDKSKKQGPVKSRGLDRYSWHADKVCQDIMPIKMLMPLPGTPGVGGAHMSTLLLGEGLYDVFGWEITYAVPPGSPSAQFFAGHGVEILPSPRKSRLEEKNGGSRLRRGISFLVLVAEALRVIHKVKPQYVTLNLKKDFLSWAVAARMKGIPVIWYVRGIRNERWDNRLRVRLSDKIVFAADAVQSAYSSERLPPNRTIRNGVRPPFFLTSRGSIRSEFKIPEDQLLVIFIGNMVPRKRPVWAAQVVCQAAGSGVDLHLVMVGETRDWSIVREVEGIFDRAGESERLTIAGYRDDIADVMQAADILMLTSRQDGEAFPRVVIEAMAKEVCVVATDVAGVGEALSDRETGFLIPPDDPDAFASVLVELGNEPGLRRTVASNAKREAKKRFTQKLVVEQFQRFICSGK